MDAVFEVCRMHPELCHQTAHSLSSSITVAIAQEEIEKGGQKCIPSFFTTVTNTRAPPHTHTHAHTHKHTHKQTHTQDH